MRRAVFLDRDGVLNRSLVRNRRPYAPVRLEDFEILPGVPEAVAALREAGYLLVVATNQPDIGAGRQSRETVDAMHARLTEALGIELFEVCIHSDADNCPCRKPRPGMLLSAAARHGIDLRQSWMIGDRWRDIAAGQAAGCRTVFVDCGYDERQPSGQDATVRSLAEAARVVLGTVDPKA